MATPLPRDRWGANRQWAFWRARERRRQRRETPIVDATLAGVLSLPPSLTHTRPSQAWDYDFAAYAIDAPRLTALGLLHEEARTNTFSYNKLNDALLQSTSQTLGTTVNIDGSGSGLTVQVAAVGVESGVPYLDYRISGSRTGVGNTFYDVIELQELLGVSPGDPDTLSAWLRLVAGSVPPAATVQLYRQYKSGADAFLAGGQTLVALDGSLARITSTTSAPATTAKISNRGLFVRVEETAADVDFTVRIGALQHEQDAIGSSPIITAGTAVTRAADTLTLDLPDGPYDVLVERADLDGNVTDGFVDAVASNGAGWNVPVDMARPYLRRLRVWPAGVLTTAQKDFLTQ